MDVVQLRRRACNGGSTCAVAILQAWHGTFPMPDIQQSVWQTVADYGRYVSVRRTLMPSLKLIRPRMMA